MLIEIISDDLFARLFGRVWGYIEELPADSPNWLKALPRHDKDRFLGTGPWFSSANRDKTLIDSERLLASPSSVRKYSFSTECNTNDWFILVADTEIDNALLIENAVDEALDKWFQHLQRESKGAHVFLVPKHPTQGRTRKPQS